MLKTVLNTATFKKTQITTISTIINGILGAFFYVLLANFLGPVEYGLLTVSIATLTLIADVADLGTNTGLVRSISAYINEDRNQAFRFLKLSLKIKFLVWIVILLLGFIVAPEIAVQIFRKPELTIPLRMSLIGVGGAMLLSFATSSLQAMQRFFAWSVVNIATNLLRLVIVLLLIFSHKLDLLSGLSVYIILPFFGFGLGLLFLPTREFSQVKNEYKVANEFFKYNLSVAIFSGIAAFSSRLDTFLNASLLTSKDVGIYGAANQLVSVMPQVISALGIVFAPKFANFKDNKQMLGYFYKAQLMVLGLALLGVVLIIPFAYFVIPLIFKVEYSLSIMPFIILFCAMLVFMISLPVHTSIIYYFARPKIFIWLSIGHLLIIGAVGSFLIPQLGVIGSAITVLIGMLFNLIVPLIWFIKKVNKI